MSDGYPAVVSLRRQLTRGLRVLTRRHTADRDLSEEARHYLEQAAADLVARGLSPEAARRTVRLELGTVATVREEVRSGGWESPIARWSADVRHATRRLRRAPGFSGISILTLALGIGACSAIFAVIHGVLIAPLPYPHSEQLIALTHTAPGINITELEMAPSLYFTYSDEQRVFTDVAIWSEGADAVTGIAEPEEVKVLAVSQRLLPMLGVAAALGRSFTPQDVDTTSAPTVMLTDGYWRSRFGGDRSILGRRLIVDGDAHEIIGVLPSSFQFMDREPALVMPLRFNRAEVRLVNFAYRGIARLKPGVTLDQASADVARMIPLAARRFQVNPGFSATIFDEARIGPALRFMKDDLVGDVGKTLWVLMGAVGIVLLVACANVANLSLVRADGRQQELAIRCSSRASCSASSAAAAASCWRTPLFRRSPAPTWRTCRGSAASRFHRRSSSLRASSRWRPVSCSASSRC
jgi:hypothetical protein